MSRAIKSWNPPRHGFCQSLLEPAGQRGRKDIAAGARRPLNDDHRRERLRDLEAGYLGGAPVRQYGSANCKRSGAAAPS